MDAAGAAAGPGGAPPQQVGGSWTVQPGSLGPGAPGMGQMGAPGMGQMPGHMGQPGANGHHPNGAPNMAAMAAAGYAQAQFGQSGQPGFGAPQGYNAPLMTLPPPSAESFTPMSPQHMPMPRPPGAQPGVPGQGMIEFIRGPLVGRVLTLAQAQDPDGAIRIGSDPRNSICLPDPSVSRRHATIRQQGPGFELADLGSTNGIYVNGAKVARHPLQPGDVIRLGGSELIFK